MKDYMLGKLNNKGLSLVELIVAISIGVIVSGSIAALITFSIRTYRNESVNTSMQYELQTNLNMMMDEIMGASVFVIKQKNSPTPIPITDPPTDAPGKPYTEYALFGNVYTPPGSTDKRIKGVIFVSEDSTGKFKVYMDRFDVNAPADLESFAELESGISGEQYLLGENLTQFAIVPDMSSFIDTPDSDDPDDSTKIKHEYRNPISFRINLSFERNGWGSKVVKKHVDDTTFLRNKVMDTVYVDGIPYNLKTKDN